MRVPAALRRPRSRPKILDNGLVETKYGDTTQKVVEVLLITCGVARIIHSLVEFSEGDNGESQALGLELVQARDDRGVSMEIVNDPIGIDEVLQAHSLGTGRVESSRLS